MSQKKVVGGFIWRFLERCTSQGVTFIISIILARILGPESYGVVSLVTVFTSIMQVFVESGLGTSLIQKKEADDFDFSSVFWFNIGMCLFLYAVMYFVAPLIANFYQMPELVAYVRVLSLILIISGLKNIQHAYVSRHMKFRVFFYASLSGTISSGIIAVFMAYRGYGVWALIAQTLINRLINTMILWIVIKWRPKFVFSWARLKGLLSFGWKLLVAKLIDTVYNDLRTLLIGKIYDATSLGYYNKGKQFPHVIVNNVNLSIDSVLFPSLSKAQDSRERLHVMTRRAIKLSTYVMMPITFGLAACAEPVVRLLLTEQWLPCVTFMRIFCITYGFYPLATANLNAIKALGRSDLFLKLEIWKKVVGVTLLLLTIQISVEAMAYSLLFSTVISQLINAHPNKSLLNYSYVEQIKDIFPHFLISSLMSVLVYGCQFLGLNDWLTLLIQIPLGITLYVLFSLLFKIDSFTYIFKVLKNLSKTRKKERGNG